MMTPLAQHWTQRLTDDCVSLDDIPAIIQQLPSRKDIPHVVNVVTTYQLIPQERIASGPRRGKRRYRLPLLALAQKFPAGKFTAKRFPAMILRIRDHSCHFTALIFGSGKVVVVHTLSKAHSLYASQVVRLILSNVQTVVRDVECNTLKLCYLGPHITLDNRRMRNFVLSGDLGTRINLQELVNTAPSIVSWSCDGFPGAEVTIFIRTPDQCTCVPSEKIKCGCKLKLLIFEAGAIVITGAVCVEDGNRVFYMFNEVAPQFDNGHAPVPRHQRYEKRLAQMLERVGEPLHKPVLNDAITEGASGSDNHEDEKEDAMVMDHVITHVTSMLGTSTITPATSSLSCEQTTPLMLAAEQGQLRLVRDMLRMGFEDVWATDDKGDNVAQRLTRLISTLQRHDAVNDDVVVYQNILNLIETHMTRTRGTSGSKTGFK